MNILVLTTAYPNESDYYQNSFIHARLLEYKKLNKKNEITVFVLSNKKATPKYIFEGIYVYKGDKNYLATLYQNSNFDKVLIHFLDYKIIDFIKITNMNRPLLVWVHGVEALSWKRRIFNITKSNFLKDVLSNIKQLKYLKKFIELYDNSIHFIFVSEWMKLIMEKDVGIKVNSYSIIPNYIDTNFYNISENKNRLNVLLIRPFSSRKYANDIAIKAIKKFESYKEFNEFKFTIVGEGFLFEQLTNLIKNNKNVKLVNKFLHKTEIKKFHNENGVLLIPTRQDSQGVTMCEGMSSGLVPITSNNTAIPEFVTDQQSGYLTNNVDDIIKAFLDVYYNKQKFEKMSQEASKSMEEKCSFEKTILKEYSLIKGSEL